MEGIIPVAAGNYYNSLILTPIVYRGTGLV